MASAKQDNSKFLLDVAVQKPISERKESDILKGPQDQLKMSSNSHNYLRPLDMSGAPMIQYVSCGNF